MREKELRLALVCFGGVSLAVYMHGVTKEIQKLARASKIYHAAPDRPPREGYGEMNDDPARETDTEAVYFDFLREIGKSLDFRIIVDVVAGASAGGINGIFLARALAHDLPLDSHRKMWLERADVLKLMDQNAIAGRWSKIYMQPFLWLMNWRRFGRVAPDIETRTKLSIFLRSRWFKPPFSGDYMTKILLDACESMGEGRTEASSLLPSGQRLDLFVSVTDFYGYGDSIPLHDPPTIREREHRHVLKFVYRRPAGQEAQSEFNRNYIPGLVFAARATSSFPGAFPPVQISEIDRVLKKQNKKWPTREDFLASKFEPLHAAGDNPLTTSFIDGSVVNNKPFAEAISALSGRPAHREVDRRIVYIDPNPDRSIPKPGAKPPGFFRTLRGALSDIPRNEPIRDELAWINTFSNRVRRVRQVFESTRPHITSLVQGLIDAADMRAPNQDTFKKWRSDANTAAAQQAGYAYSSYVHLKIMGVLESLTKLIADQCGCIHDLSRRRELSIMLEQWAHDQGILPVGNVPADHEIIDPDKQFPWVRFLRSFDVNFRIRRIRLVIRRLNELYHEIPVGEACIVDSDCLNEFKTTLYEILDLFEQRWRRDFHQKVIGGLAQALLENKDLSVLNDLVEKTGNNMTLKELDLKIDEIFSVMALNYLPEVARKELIPIYIGFAFFDVLTFPTMQWEEVSELDEINVDRISPEDATAIRKGGAKATLRGIRLGHFGAFFSRKDRENDYLWGRLHATDRLVDIVMSSVREKSDVDIDVDNFKRRLFHAILDTEKDHLPSCEGLIASLRREIGAA